MSDTPSTIAGQPVSHSRLSTYFECSKKWELKYLHREIVQETPMWAGVGGTAFHSATEQIDREGSWDPSPEGNAT